MKQLPALAVLAVVLLTLWPDHPCAADLRVLSARVVQEPLDLKVVGPIPQAIGMAVGYEAAIPTGSREVDAARALIGYLTGPTARDHFKRADL